MCLPFESVILNVLVIGKILQILLVNQKKCTKLLLFDPVIKEKKVGIVGDTGHSIVSEGDSLM